MSLRRTIALAIILMVVGAVTYFGFRIAYIVRRIPEAYAAWDTGTLLVEYLKSHDDKWPSSWDDLLSVMSRDSTNQIVLRGSNAGDTNYAFSLCKKVAIDWKFDPSRSNQSSPVTRLNGTKFPIMWAGAEPNKMVSEYLKTRTDTNTLPYH